MRDPEVVVADFHSLYYEASARTWAATRWLGYPAQKCPLDLWIYQELLFETQPDVVVETGTCEGGSALFLATIMDLLGFGRVITVDIKDGEGRPAHPRIEYVLGSSTDEEVVSRVHAGIPANARVTAILDSDHSRDHVSAELELYGPRVSPGCHMIVEDTNINGNPVLPAFGPGPSEAVASFLASHDEFEIDHSCEKFFMTFNPGGYLQRVR